MVFWRISPTLRDFWKEHRGSFAIIFMLYIMGLVVVLFAFIVICRSIYYYVTDKKRKIRIEYE